jgi:hypothetical protein
MMVRDAFAAYIIDYNCTDGYCVTFAAREYTVGANGVHIDFTVFWFVRAYSTECENMTA